MQISYNCFISLIEKRFLLLAFDDFEKISDFVYTVRVRVNSPYLNVIVTSEVTSILYRLAL